MTLLTVIPARLGSTRLAGKPLRLLGGVPLVVRVFERVSACGFGEHCVVATDSDKVISACADHGVPAVMTSSAHASGTDRIAEIARRTEYLQHDVVLNVQGDEPFVTRDALIAAVSPVLAGSASIGTVAVRAQPDILAQTDVVKVVQTDDGRALYFSRAPIPFLRDADDAALQHRHIRQHIGVYAYSREALVQWVSLPEHPLERIERLEQLRPLAHGLSIAVTLVTAAPERGIDTEDDLIRANERWPAFAARARATDIPTQIPSTA